MDNTEFVERLEKIAVALGKLPNEMYKATKPGVSGEVRSAVVEKAKLRLKEYEEFLPILSPGRRESANERCRSALEEVNDFIKQLESTK